jgi:Flp pilus assembly protein TadG
MVHKLRCQRGQAIVEFVIVLPVLFLMVIFLVYAAMALNHKLLVTDLARVGARAAAVDRFDNPSANSCAAAQAAVLEAAGSSVVATCDPNGAWGTAGLRPGDPLTVTVTYPWVPDVLLFGSVDLTSSSQATERLE